MIKCKGKQLFLVFLFLLGTVSMLQTVQAESYSYIKDEMPYVYDLPSMKDGKAIIQWMDYSSYVEAGEGQFSYELEVADNELFIGAKQYSTNLASLALDKSELGEHGGKCYVRVRYVLQLASEVTPIYSQWSEKREFTFVAIDKVNFPGLYKLLLNGGKDINMDGTFEKIVYDTNGDGWLDPAEIHEIWSLETRNETKKVNGKYKTIKATNVSSFEGIEYLTELSYIHVERYSGKTADLSKRTNIDNVWISGITAKQFTLNAPSARDIYVEAANDNKITKMDVSKCSSVVDLTVYGNAGTKTLKLPKEKKKLKVLSLSDFKMKSVSLNAYTNLQQAYFYEVDTKSVKVNKCKNLRYIYFFFCDEIKSLNLKSNKKLRGADFYKTPGLTKSTVKRPKNGKYTWDKGKWWYSTDAYKKDMKNLY